jgi:hypothetical protein
MTQLKELTNPYHTTVSREIERCAEQLVKMAFEPVVLQAGAGNASEQRVDKMLALADRIVNIRQHLSGHEQMFVDSE